MDDGELGLPPSVGPYHSLYPLEDPAAAAKRGPGALGVSSLLIKGLAAEDGAAAALRRLDPRRVRGKGVRWGVGCRQWLATPTNSERAPRPRRNRYLRPQPVPPHA